MAQLMAMSGTTHRLVNGVVLLGPRGRVAGVDVQTVTMSPFDESAARSYVEQHRPFDTAGSYRLEDDAGLVESVRGEHASGVLGLPLPLVSRMVGQLSR